MVRICSEPELKRTLQNFTALTNINSTCDLREFVKLCREDLIKPVVGVEFCNGDKLLYILIAANNKGISWINSFLSEHLPEKNDFPEPVIGNRKNAYVTTGRKKNHQICADAVIVLK